jgi:hypothetical protein
MRALARHGPLRDSELLEIGDLELNLSRPPVRRGTARNASPSVNSRYCNCLLVVTGKY